MGSDGSGGLERKWDGGSGGGGFGICLRLCCAVLCGFCRRSGAFRLLVKEVLRGSMSRELIKIVIKSSNLFMRFFRNPI